MDKTTLTEKIISALREIYDPELPVNIYDMGLIYETDVDDNCNVNIIMTVTAPNCPVADYLPVKVEKNLSVIEEINKIHVKLTFDPPWTPDRMTDEAKLELGML